MPTVDNSSGHSSHRFSQGQVRLGSDFVNFAYWRSDNPQILMRLPCIVPRAAHDLEQAVVDDLARMRLATPEVASWFRTELRAAVNDLTAYRRQQAASLAKRKSELSNMRDRLLNAYLSGTVEEVVFKAKTNELRAEAAKTEEALATAASMDPTRGDNAVALFDWTQRAADIWRGSNNRVRRQILDVVCLNRSLSDAKLVTTKRKPFDAFTEGLVSKNSRGNRTSIELFWGGLNRWPTSLLRVAGILAHPFADSG